MADDMQAFSEVLESCGEAAEKVEGGGGSWEPPVGSYLCLFSRLSSGTMDDGTVWAKPHFIIMDEGEHFEREFTKYPWFLANGGKDLKTGEPSYSLVDLIRFTSCLAGREVRDVGEANKVLTAACGNSLVTIRADRGKRKGKAFYIYQGVDKPVEIS